MKKIYEKVDEEQAFTVIHDVEKRAEAMDFFRELETFYKRVVFPRSTIEELLKDPLPPTWYEFLARSRDFTREWYAISSSDNEPPRTMEGIGSSSPLRVIFIQPDSERQVSMSARVAKLEKTYSAFLEVSADQRRYIVDDFIRNNRAAFTAPTPTD